MIQPQLPKSSTFGRPAEKKWGEDTTTAKRDVDDRINLRLTSLERRADNVETAMKVGVFVVVVAGTSVAAYQNWDTIQGAASRTWASLPTSAQISSGISERWEALKGYFKGN